MPSLSRTARVNFVVNGQVVAVEDGDTLTLRAASGDRFRIRMSDYDAPEVAHASNPYRDHNGDQRRRNCPRAPPQARGQPGGEAAAASLRALAPLHVQARAECYESDGYGRFVCHVFVGTTNLNLEQLRRGWGMTASKSRWIRDPASRPVAQAARLAGVGIWAEPEPIVPATWRNNCWCRADCAGAAP